MVRFTKDLDVYINITVAGVLGSGKNKLIDILYRFTKEENKDIKPTGDLTKIEMASGKTLYLDKGIFQSTKQKNVYFRLYNIPSQPRFSKLRAKMLSGIDGLIFVVDADPICLNLSIESIKELNNLLNGNLIKKIPFVVMLNNKNLTAPITSEQFLQILKKEGLWYDESHKISIWNPKIYSINITYRNAQEIYNCFSECARRIILYNVYGNGTAPTSEKVLNLKKSDFFI